MGEVVVECSHARKRNYREDVYRWASAYLQIAPAWWVDNVLEIEVLNLETGEVYKTESTWPK